jgi:hypothetical protein
MAIDFGLDTDASTGLQFRRSLVGGARNLANAAVRRLSTRRGSLRYAPNYGFDIRELIQDAMDSADVRLDQGAIEQELEKDDRFLRATATITGDAKTGTVDMAIEIFTDDGPFRLVVRITNVTVELLEVT